MPYHIDYSNDEVEDEEEDAEDEDGDDIGGMSFGFLNVISSLMWSLVIHLSGIVHQTNI